MTNKELSKLLTKTLKKLDKQKKIYKCNKCGVITSNLINHNKFKHYDNN